MRIVHGKVSQFGTFRLYLPHQEFILCCFKTQLFIGCFIIVVAVVAIVVVVAAVSVVVFRLHEKAFQDIKGHFLRNQIHALYIQSSLS